jgi:putative ABC transport system ATP-binding protein
METKMNVLRLESISKSFNQGSPSETIALFPLNIEFEKGSYTIILGSNGSGKSTFLKLIAGDILPDKGNLYLNNQNITKRSDYKRSGGIARIFQDPAFGTAPDLSLIENFRLASLRDRPKLWVLGITSKFKQNVRDELSKLAMGLENRLHAPMSSFSGGQRQAISLLMATMAPCDLLLMDEPTAALDPKASERVMELARDIIKDKNLTAIMVSHNLSHALKYGSRILFFNQGKIQRDIEKSTELNLGRDNLAAWFEE